MEFGNYKVLSQRRNGYFGSRTFELLMAGVCWFQPSWHFPWGPSLRGDYATEEGRVLLGFN
jgi:hypothetical protein